MSCTYVCTAVAAVHMTSWRMIVSNCLSCGKITGEEVDGVATEGIDLNLKILIARPS